MAVKAVEMVRRIRDRHFEETKGLSVEKQINLRVPIFCLNLNQAARVSPVACLRSI